MEIAEIKSKLSISKVLQHYGLKPNRNKMLCCPFHEDKKPSMQVYPETNTVHCFSGNCPQTGKAIDQIDFILHKEGCTKHEALLKAKKLLGESIIEKVNQKHAGAKDQPVNYSELYAKMQQALPRSKKAVEYLEGRGIYDAKLAAGYNNGTLYRQLKNCIVFPLRNQQDEIVSLYGRSITENEENRHYYLKDRRGLYPHYPHRLASFLVLTESIIDAATIQKYTDYQVLALYGTNGLSEEHRQALCGLKELKEIILFFDGDQAGRSAVEKYSKELSQLLPEVQISKVETPEGEDPNSLVQSHEPEIITHLIENRIKIENRINVFSSTETPSTEEKEPSEEKEAPKPSTSTLNTRNPEYLTYSKANLLISILGGVGLHPLDKLKVTLKIERTDSISPLHSLRHSLDLYHDDQAEKLIRKTAERLELGSREVMLAIAELTQEIENYRLEQIEQQKPKKAEKRILTAAREKRAIDFLKAPRLLERTNELISKSGMVGEEVNRLLMYLVFTSRLREQPLHIISLGASGTGKTYLQEKIAELIPEEHKLEITALSENALYYFERKELKNKLVLIEDLDGASDDKVLFAIRELQSKKKISKTIPIKDSKGNLKTITLQVEGPITLAGTTTREKLYEDNANRSILIYLDSSPAHKEQIMNYQRRLSAGSINRKEEEMIREFCKDVQTVLKPVQVRNPYAEKLIIPETVFKPLRTNAHYLNFIEVITFYHQYQREVKRDPATGESYIETTLEDIGKANELLKDVLLSKSDELTKSCRDFLETLKGKLQSEKQSSFYKHQVREWMRINPHNLKYYLKQLVQYGYLKVIGGNQYKQGYEYEVTDREEYLQLQGKLVNALDAALEQLKRAA